MSRTVILTTKDSGAGHLKAILRGEKVLCFPHRLVRDPAPRTADIAEFFAQRRSIYSTRMTECGSWENWCDDISKRSFDWITSSLQCYDFVEIWTDPSPNTQLVLMQLLTWLGRQHPSAISKLRLVNVDDRLEEREPNDPRSANPTPVEVDESHLHAAALAWDAFLSPTPELWADLVLEDLSFLPHLPALVLRMLGELPAEDTALGSSEARVLALVEPGEAPVMEVMRGYLDDGLRMLEYWEIGKVIDLFAEGADRAVLGLDEGPFVLALHDNSHRFERYKGSRLSLSQIGRALLGRRDDFVRHGRVNRWWGGTYLTNDVCWRWSVATKRLIPPP